MFTSLPEGLMADEPTWMKPRPESTRAGSIHDTATPEQGMSLEEGFNWGRIRRLAKKG